MNDQKPSFLAKTPYRSRRTLLGLGLVLTLSALAGCDVVGTTTKVKVTATVDVNGTLYSGSAVQEYRCFEGGGILGSMNVGRCEVKGEAVVVDLKERGHLFLLFKGPHGDVSSLAYALLHAKDKAWWKRSWALETKEMPMMVTFKDNGDPKSVREIDPKLLRSNFGQGVSLKSVNVAYSMDAITRGNVEKALPWMTSMKSKRGALDGTSGWSNDELSNQLSPIHFISRK